MTLIGLTTLFLVPIAVGIRIRHDFTRIERLEQARQSISKAIEVARRSDMFLMHRYIEPGNTNGRFVPDQEYTDLVKMWTDATSHPEAIDALDATGRSNWRSGTTLVSHWIESFLVRYAGKGNYPSTHDFELEEPRFRHGLNALLAARDGAADQQDELRKKQAWLNTAQLTVVTPMAIICFALAFLAWMNVRTLQQTWMREREISASLAVAVQESNHRIKNNLQVIGALIDMKMQEPGAMVPKAALEDVVHQVRAVAAVHDFFSHELRSDQIQGDQMLRRLVELTASPIGLHVDLETEAMALAVRQATAIALITNELLLNSGKHGATEARVEMKTAGTVAWLRVSDNGPGFPPDFDATVNANLGLALVDTLARHDLQGDLLCSNDGGATVEVTFPLAGAA